MQRMNFNRIPLKFTLTPVALISAAAALPLSSVRQVMMTRAPAPASTRAVSFPMPELPPGHAIDIKASKQVFQVWAFHPERFWKPLLGYLPFLFVPAARCI